MSGKGSQKNHAVKGALFNDLMVLRNRNMCSLKDCLFSSLLNLEKASLVNGSTTHIDCKEVGT